MIVLALDTAGADCAAALYESSGNTMLGEASEMIGKGHAERLMGMIESALASAGRTLADVGRIAVTIGPGSFTGIRVGVAAARGLALSLGVPAVGVTTLSVMAAARQALVPAIPVLAAMDAKRGEVYIQSFDENGMPDGEPRAASLDDAREVAARFHGEIVGSAAALLLRKEQAAERDRFPIAAVARLGAALDPASHKPKPLYLRGPDAKPQTGFALQRV